MCINHRSTVTKTRRSSTATNICSSWSFQTNSIKVSGNIAKLQQQWFSRIILQMFYVIRPFHCFAEFAYQVQWLGPTNTSSMGCNMQYDYSRTVGTHMQLSLYTLILSVWLGLAVCLHRCPQTQYCTHRTATISKGDVACIKVHHRTSEKWLDSAVTKCTFWASVPF